MKISLSKLFDVDAVIKRLQEAKVQGLEEFVTSISELNDKLIMALRSNLSISDNIDCVEKVVNLSHDTKITIENPDRIKQVKHITPTRALPFDNPLTSFAWAYNANGSIDIKADFKGSPTRPVSVTLIMYF